IAYDIPIMKQYLEETYGITVYQEQVMLLSRLLANFTRGESDMLRKAMGKKQIDKMAKLKVKFMEQGQANGHKEEVLEKIWADWEKFASYAFNKSHATCYSWVAYQTAYLKAHYPAEYMAGVLSRNLNAADKLSKIMDECKRMGVTVKGPDINESSHKFSVTKNGEIRFGLSGIKSVGESAVNAIVKERKDNGPYQDIYDFVERVNLSACNRGSIEALALAGAFDSLGIDREMIVAPIVDTTYADILVKYGQSVQNSSNSMLGSLFDDLEPIATARPAYPDYTPWNRLQLLEAEKSYVTMYLSAHPLDPYYMELKYGCNTSCDEFESKQEDGAVLTLGGMVVGLDEKISRKGKAFGILTIEDFNGKTQIRLFGKNYDSIREKVSVGDAIYMKVSCRASSYNPDFLDTNFDEITPLEQIRGKISNAVRITIPKSFSNKEFLESLRGFESTSDNDRKGDFYIRIVDMERKQYLTLHTRKKYRIDKEFIQFLEEWGVDMQITTLNN
ncbi:MAG: DNA polymerase III subunit alpha, partial [Muribaculaceae bacterium]|nr:DNA polymerase III subunit alpha [Muribaculaceae bacterium]